MVPLEPTRPNRPGPSGRRIVALMLALSLAMVAQPVAGSKFNFIQETRSLLEIRPLTAADGTSEGPHRLEVHPETGGEVRFRLEWPTPGSPVDVRLTARDAIPPRDLERAVELEAELTFPDGKVVRAARPIAFDQTSTALFEVHREGNQPLTLAVVASTFVATVVDTTPRAGAPVRFRVEIQRVLEGRSISLETNMLNTFVGQDVSYSFQLGRAGEADAARLRLRPLRVRGEIIEIEVELSGTLPNAEETLVASRKENWVTSRRATSTLTLESGAPPSGYRFLVTPEF